MFGSISLRTAAHRHTRYQDGAEELFDAISDPQMRSNLIGDPSYAQQADALRLQLEQLRTGWMNTALPKCRVTLWPLGDPVIASAC